jgi:hypothetical protein
MKYCQCDYKVGQSSVTLDLALFRYYCMKHVFNQGVPYHMYQATMFKDMCL